MRKLLILLVVLGAASSASALEYVWDHGGGANNNWMTATNWNATGFPDTLPAMTGVNAGLAKLYPNDNSLCNFLVNSAGPEAFQAKVGGPGGGLTWSTLTVTDGGVLNSGEWLMVGTDSTTGGGRSGQLNMTGGTINLGVVTPANGHLFLGSAGTATKGFVNMSGGTINVTGMFGIGYGTGTSGTANISGGTIYTSQIGRNAAATLTLLNVTGTGKVVINGDSSATLATWKSNGWLNAGAVYDYGITTPGKTTITPEPATLCLLGIGALSLIRRKR